jgi:hypothetical protein
MKTIENPSTKAKAEPSTLARFPSPSLSCSTPIPESIETYPGTNGSTHGDRNETSPARNAAKIDTSPNFSLHYFMLIMCARLDSLVAVKFPLKSYFLITTRRAPTLSPLLQLESSSYVRRTQADYW